MRRAFLFLVISLLLVSWLAACGGAAAEPTATLPAPAVEEPTEAPSQPTEPPPMEEPTEAPTEAPMEEPTEAPTEEPTEEQVAEGVDMVFDGCEESYEGETITFYQQAGLTGPLATILGPSFINGTNDAVAAVNESGGICGATIEIDLTDTQYDPEQELAAYEENRAEEPPPMFVLTYASPASVVLKDRVIEDQIVNIASGLNAEAFYVPRNGWTVGTAPIYSDQFAGFVEWAQDNWDDIKPEGAGDDIVVGVIGWEGSFGAGATTPEALAYRAASGNAAGRSHGRRHRPDPELSVGWR
jgi:branched-chain amino acid transport system substrate-binding protein